MRQWCTHLAAFPITSIMPLQHRPPLRRRLRVFNELPVAAYVPRATDVIALRHIEVDAREIWHARQLALREVWLDRMQRFLERLLVGDFARIIKKRNAS